MISVLTKNIVRAFASTEGTKVTLP